MVFCCETLNFRDRSMTPLAFEFQFFFELISIMMKIFPNEEHIIHRWAFLVLVGLFITIDCGYSVFDTIFIFTWIVQKCKWDIDNFRGLLLETVLYRLLETMKKLQRIIISFYVAYVSHVGTYLWLRIQYSEMIRIIITMAHTPKIIPKLWYHFMK